MAYWSLMLGSLYRTSQSRPNDSLIPWVPRSRSNCCHPCWSDSSQFFLRTIFTCSQGHQTNWQWSVRPSIGFTTAFGVQYPSAQRSLGEPNIVGARGLAAGVIRVSTARVKFINWRWRFRSQSGIWVMYKVLFRKK